MKLGRFGRALSRVVAVSVAVTVLLAGCAGTPDELPPGERPILTDGPGAEPLTSDDPLQFIFDPRGMTGEIVVVEVAAFVPEAAGGNASAGGAEAGAPPPAARRWELTPESQSPLRVSVPLDGLEDGVAYELEFTLVDTSGFRAVVANRVPLKLVLGLPRPVPRERELVTLSRRQALSWRFPAAEGAAAEGAARGGGDAAVTAVDSAAAAGASAVVRINGGLADGSEYPGADAIGPWEPEEPLVDAGAFSRRQVAEWQVRVVSRRGVLGPWSPEGRIIFDPSRAVPQPRAHTGGGEAIVATPGLSWETTAGAVAYRVELGVADSRDAGGESSVEPGAGVRTAEPVILETDTSHVRLDPGQLETLLDAATTRRLQWRVAAIGPDGVETPRSDYFEFRYVPFMGGLETVVPVSSQVTVILGSAEAGEADERPAVPVALELPFEMTRYPVTNRVVAALVQVEVAAGRMEVIDGLVRTTAESPRTLIGLEALDFGTQVGLQAEEGQLTVRDGYAAHPAVGLTWYGALAVANALSLLEARDPVYEGLSSSDEEIVIHPARDGYRLPTEAEWAAAVAARQRIVAGAELTIIEDRELTSVDLRGINHLRSGDRWDDPRPPYTRNGGPTSPVGSVGPGSPLGISDLIGNVWEWTADWYDPRWYRRISEGEAEGTPWAGPVQPVPDVYDRLLRTVRGTAWNTPQEEVRPGNRGGFAPEATSHSIGVRLTRTLQEQ